MVEAYTGHFLGLGDYSTVLSRVIVDLFYSLMRAKEVYLYIQTCVESAC